MYLSKLAQRTGEDSMSVTYSDLASVVQVWIKSIAIAIDVTDKSQSWSGDVRLRGGLLFRC